MTQAITIASSKVDCIKIDVITMMTSGVSIFSNPGGVVFI